VPDAELIERAVAVAKSMTVPPAATLLETRRLLDLTSIHNQLQLEAVAIRTAAKQPEFKAALKDFLDAHSS